MSSQNDRVIRASYSEGRSGCGSGRAGLETLTLDRFYLSIQVAVDVLGVAMPPSTLIKGNVRTAADDAHSAALAAVTQLFPLHTTRFAAAPASDRVCAWIEGFESAPLTQIDDWPTAWLFECPLIGGAPTAHGAFRKSSAMNAPAISGGRSGKPCRVRRRCHYIHAGRPLAGPLDSAGQW